ncbi:hypothetical protein RUM43_014505 [Polyplax serrata]|uniref:S-methyl-5'-thioadenosine phosphorylase n=1 Tax=Polyplax serrata TaxID=468196 RepID=A0AAN8S3H5_POLSC
MNYEIKVGIIGGSGLDNPDIISGRIELNVSTPFGPPSDTLIEGTIENVPCILLPRHGKNHDLMPSSINYRANIWALKSVGCTHILASTACGSLKEEVAPGDLIILDGFVDRTKSRHSTFYDNSCGSFSGVCHMPMEPAFCEKTRKILIECAKALNLRCHPSGTCVTIEGPRFSSKAESNIFRSWNCDVVNMTTVPEVVLAKEAGLCYAAVGLVTDYDCWKSSGENVNVPDVLLLFKKNVKRVTDLLTAAVNEIGKRNWDDTLCSLQELIRNNTM